MKQIDTYVESYVEKLLKWNLAYWKEENGGFYWTLIFFLNFLFNFVHTFRSKLFKNRPKIKSALKIKIT